jgi:hypothetical protein
MDYLATLSEFVGRPLVTDWAASGHQEGRARLSDDDIAAVRELLKDPFFERFYA